MGKYFDEAKWQLVITQPDWYVTLYSELQTLRQQWEAADTAEATAIKQAVRGFFEHALEANELALAEHGPNLDAGRQPIDTVVIHHTSAAPGYYLPYLNAVHLLNIYVPYFMHPTVPGEEQLKGQPLWSGHVRHGRPVFYAYHWLMRMDGTFERLLEDDEIGWHAGSWGINRRSIAICLDNDYEYADPSPDILQKLGEFIAAHYPHVPSERIFGHGEASNQPTLCPGAHFDHWKSALVHAVQRAAES